MSRTTNLRAVLLPTLLAGCAARASLPHEPSFPTPEDNEIACLDLRDHIVELYADEYLAEHNEFLREPQRELFVEAWAIELARQGTFDRFYASCESGLTVQRFRCGIAASNADALTACMRLSR